MFPCECSIKCLWVVADFSTCFTASTDKGKQGENVSINSEKYIDTECGFRLVCFCCLYLFCYFF